MFNQDFNLFKQCYNVINSKLKTRRQFASREGIWGSLDSQLTSKASQYNMGRASQSILVCSLWSKGGKNFFAKTTTIGWSTFLTWKISLYHKDKASHIVVACCLYKVSTPMYNYWLSIEAWFPLLSSLNFCWILLKVKSRFKILFTCIFWTTYE